MESQDFEKVVAAQSDLSNSQYDLRRVQDASANFKAMKEEEETFKAERIEQEKNQPNQQAHQTQQNNNEVDERAVDWAETNKWFGEDEIMTGAVLAVDAKMKAEGWTPEDDDYYNEVDTRMKNAFPHKYESEEEGDNSEKDSQYRKGASKRLTQTVSGGSRTPKSSSTKIKLTEADVAQAKKWNIPLDRYAAEKLKANNADEEYTDITL
jgi:hypothetical protein